MDIHIFKNEFDAIFLESINNFAQSAIVRSDNPYIRAAIAHSLVLAGSGKRIRPYNTALAYEAYTGTSWKDIGHVLVGIELIHLMALIHDDIMDNAHTRHGVDTIHEHTKKNIAALSSSALVDHTSLSTAILVGDMVFGWAFASISKKTISQEAWQVIHELVEEVIVGQMMDIMTPLEKNATDASVEKKMLLKTARYTFARPLVLGALCAGKKNEDVLWLREFGDALGLMFQAQDDLLDITASVTLLKKNTLGDIKNGVHTLISVYVSEHATEEEKATWNAWFGNNVEIDPVTVNEFLKHIGALEYVETYISKQKITAENILSVSDISDIKKNEFKKIIDMLSHRKY